MILLIVFFAIASGCSREAVVGCLLNHFDTNEDGQITLAEWGKFLLESPCASMIPRISPLTVMEYCDQDKDGVLTVADYDHPYSCLNAVALRNSVCTVCDACGEL